MSVVFYEKEMIVNGVKYVSSNAYIAKYYAEERAQNLRERGYDSFVENFDNLYYVMTEEK